MPAHPCFSLGMTFEQLLDAAIDLLSRRHRITYAALRRQFGLLARLIRREAVPNIQFLASRSVLSFLTTSTTSLTQMLPHKLAGRGYPLTGFSGVSNSLVMGCTSSSLALSTSPFCRAGSCRDMGVQIPKINQ